MDRIKLRAHNLAVVRDYRTKTDVLKKAQKDQLIRVYGESFAEKAIELCENVHDGTLVEIVRGTDDLCNKGCSFLESCDQGDYVPVVSALIEDLPPETPKYDLKMFRSATPETSDIDAEEFLGVEVGKTYVLGEIGQKDKF